MNILQRSEDWHAERCGKVTASRVKDLNAKPSKGKALNALGLTILAERLTGVQKETPTNVHGDIRHLEKSPCRCFHINRVHGDIRHLEIYVIFLE